MPKLSIIAGATSQTVNVFIADSSSTTGAGLTGLAFNTASLTAYYALPKAAAVAITLATLAAVTSAYSSGGFKEIDSTNMPGWYRFDVPDAAIASGRFVSIHLKGATNMAPLPLEIELTAWNNQDAVRGGLTALPNANAGATNGLPLAVDNSGRVDVLKINGTSQTARDIGASVLLSAGTGTGQLDFTSGVVKANLAQILGTALTETAGLLAGGFKKFFNVVSPSLTCLGIDQTGDSYARLGAPAGASHAADVAAVKADTAAVKVQTDKLAFTVANQVDSNVIDWKGATAPAMTGDAFARLGAPAGASVSADVAAVKADTAGIAALPTATANADALLKRDMSAVSGEAARSPLNALRALRNKTSIAAGTLTVTKEDDAATAWTGVVTTDVAALPITAIDPA